jgi:hypothetical protein
MNTMMQTHPDGFTSLEKKTSYLKSICTFILISLVKYVELKPKMLHTNK